MKLLASSLFKNTAPEPTKTASSSWPWPSCTQTRTISFRNPGKDEIFKTINSAFDESNTPESFFTNSSEGCASFSTVVSDDEDSIETVITKGLTSDRLFFDPGESSSILENDPVYEKGENEDEDGNIPFKKSVALSMDSPDPYVDFKKSMEEMVKAHGLKEWEDLEELLCWYLRVNGKSNHGYIVGAFVDLLVGIAFRASTTINPPSPSSSSSCCNSCSDEYYSPSTPLSFYTTTTSCSSSSTSTPCNVSSIGGHEEGSEMSTSTIPYLSSLLEAEEEIN